MIILGIETSCDETAAAVCRDGSILSSVIASQEIHRQYGGVVPEIASREHEKQVALIVEEALARAAVAKEHLDAIAVTRGPGLMGALLTGVSFASGLSQGLGIPCLGMNHMEAHIFANFIAYPELNYPFLSLLISGGHTQIWRVNGFGTYELLGETRDDAAGEAFDKGARILGLDYPGGPAIEKAAEGGNEDAVMFPQAFLKSDNIEFSFSGLKTALLNYVKKNGDDLIRQNQADIAASYQAAIIGILLNKLRLAADQTGIRTAVIGGGVAANQKMREKAETILDDCTVLYPDSNLCTDNAAMVAFVGELYLKSSSERSRDLAVIPNLRLASQ
ncbi:MAG: tRNA (adenosine(37)-N6)-threonylcarbamoyltransferase complex transferase subunit TsaD [Candidatus Marinimicrobia bacterium]|jgi:N6-L-threonylcarbamoyladenine synthase|nr:tRNA (adenosine(37)-N6)-threonylcarbamoyltransferase complex transferase subunit TsaD [Candidatus Neomarinimicrobiota bacterium]MDP6456403.1 tRNA (adenosine(37)-N6)-threonylcarbamoyltransferase complex transferase subunit TsaD [Candidatus Neomarinimicrobiota bacterium]MDP6593653.1 tRNA (adenosine(37)-N6)-threonylcarbamoyltransferase complex transferase subunit TsaD [Candidatus Neomarinimicrobiota bacterium]MDP6836203.1 tRNA (adenosine(37)-N6)-threonylcarbamoyltransferase complex transferase s|tara:strand:- start:2553 stop:3551 length:999 start_codon:yes stop_codon:yes gene_type:complete